jgi:hypothetical protein
MKAQRLLNLPISLRTVLLDVNAVRIARGVDAETVAGWADGNVMEGGLQWVFDVATTWPGKKRALRFWAREVSPETAATTVDLTIEQVIDLMVPPTRQHYHTWEVKQLLLISPPTMNIHSVNLRGAIVAGRFVFERRELANFLRHRWERNRPRLTSTLDERLLASGRYPNQQQREAVNS